LLGLATNRSPPGRLLAHQHRLGGLVYANDVARSEIASRSQPNVGIV
jgi:hypothetical protein